MSGQSNIGKKKQRNRKAVMICGIHNWSSQPDSQLKGLIKSRVLLILTPANSLVAADSDKVEEAYCAGLRHEIHLHPLFLQNINKPQLELLLLEFISKVNTFHDAFLGWMDGHFKNRALRYSYRSTVSLAWIQRNGWMAHFFLKKGLSVQIIS